MHIMVALTLFVRVRILLRLPPEKQLFFGKAAFYCFGSLFDSRISDIRRMVCKSAYRRNPHWLPTTGRCAFPWSKTGQLCRSHIFPPGFAAAGRSRRSHAGVCRCMNSPPSRVLLTLVRFRAMFISYENSRKIVSRLFIICGYMRIICGSLWRHQWKFCGSPCVTMKSSN